MLLGQLRIHTVYLSHYTLSRCTCTSSRLNHSTNLYETRLTGGPCVRTGQFVWTTFLWFEFTEGQLKFMVKFVINQEL